jgi:hypothetical protein
MKANAMSSIKTTKNQLTKQILKKKKNHRSLVSEKPQTFVKSVFWYGGKY